MKKPVSIKWKIFASLVFFIAIVIVVLWLFQVFFLENFYMSIKSNAVKKAASQINEIITSDKDTDKIQTIAKENDFCIEIYENNENEIGKLNQVYPQSQEDLRCRIKNIQQSADYIIALQEDVVRTGEMASQMVNHTNQDRGWKAEDVLLWNPVLQNGINKKALEKYGGEVNCFMPDEDVAKQAKEQGSTRATASMDKAASMGKPLIFAIGNAPTALVRLYELIEEKKISPYLIIGVPVGFVNVVQSKEMIMDTEVPYIVARGRKGGSNIAACICNALLYMIDNERDYWK